MPGYQLVTAYRDIPQYRHSFNRLTSETFGFDLEEWYGRGFWTDRYVPYSYLDGDRVIANISINRMDLVLQGEPKKAIQLGTVMTHPDYRGRGLAGDLLRLLLEKYRPGCDLIYLFANEEAFGFYEKLGFSPVTQSRFTAEVPAAQKRRLRVEKMDAANPEVLAEVCRFAGARRPVSRIFGVENGQNLLMFYCLYLMGDCLYRCPEENVIAICRKKDRTLHVFDLIGAAEFEAAEVLAALAGEAERIEFYFTPDLLPVKAESSPLPPEEALWTLETSTFPAYAFRSPKMAEA